MKSFKSKILALLAGLGVAYQVQRPPEMEHIEKPIAVEKPEIIETSRPEINLAGMIGQTPEEARMITEAIKSANAVMRTECFRNSILDGKFTETNGLTNSQIYNLIASKKVNTKVKMFTGSFTQNHVYKTMGYDIGDGITYANRYFVKDADMLASLIMHEAEGHGQGFHHYNAKNTSVPYSLNSIYDKCSN